MKQSADDNYKFDENSRKFSKRVENTVGKGEITRDEPRQTAFENIMGQQQTAFENIVGKERTISSGFCPGRAFSPFVQKIAEGAKKSK